MMAMQALGYGFFLKENHKKSLLIDFMINLQKP